MFTGFYLLPPCFGENRIVRDALPALGNVYIPLLLLHPLACVAHRHGRGQLTGMRRPGVGAVLRLSATLFVHPLRLGRCGRTKNILKGETTTPGIIAVLEREPTGLSREIAEGIADRMYESSGLSRRLITRWDGVSVIILHTGKDSYGVFESGDWLVVWYGWPLYKGRSVTEDILKDCAENLADGDVRSFFRDWYGHFQAVVYSRKDHELVVAADKISTHPVYYTDGGSYVAVSPETLSFCALAKYGWQPGIRKGAIYEYLASGHLWGDGTFWNEVFRLGPGQYVYANGAGIACRFYWQATYNPSDESEERLKEKLAEAIERDVATLPPGKGLLTLSGGADSRSLLCFLDALKVPFGAVSYNFGDAQTASDASVGEYYAKKLGADHFFYDADLTDTTRLIDDIHRAIAATGGECDTVASQDAFLGTRFYQELSRRYDYILRGDEAWGGRMPAGNLDLVFLDSHLYTLREFPQPERILLAEAFAEGADYLRRQQNRYARECPSSAREMDDLREYIFWRHRSPRLLQTMAYFRRMYLPQFAPFLFEHTLDAIAVTPSSLRTNKSLFMEMNRDRFPEFFRDPNAPNPLMTEGTRFDRIYRDPYIQALIRDALIQDPPASLRRLLDPEKTRDFVDSILTEEGSRIRAQNRSYNLLRIFRNIADKSPGISARLECMLVCSGVVKYPYLNSKYLFRMLVLALALREHEAVIPGEVSAGAEASAPGLLPEIGLGHSGGVSGKSFAHVEAQRQ